MYLQYTRMVVTSVPALLKSWCERKLKHLRFWRQEKSNYTQTSHQWVISVNLMLLSLQTRSREADVDQWVNWPQMRTAFLVPTGLSQHFQTTVKQTSKSPQPRYLLVWRDSQDFGFGYRVAGDRPTLRLYLKQAMTCLFLFKCRFGPNN